MIGDPLVDLASRIEHALAVVDRDIDDAERRRFVRPLLSRAHAAGHARYPGVAAFYLFQALGEVLSWRDPPFSPLREDLLELAVAARALTRWTGETIPRDSLEAARDLETATPIAGPAAAGLDLAGLEEALQRLGEDVLHEEVPPRLMKTVQPPEVDPDAG